MKNNNFSKKFFLEEARKINNLWDNDIKNIMSEMEVVDNDFKHSDVCVNTLFI